MRAAGVFISALSHVVLVALALFGTPKLFDDVLERPSIEVDIVRADEAPPVPEKPPEKPPEKSNEINPFPQRSEPAPQAESKKAPEPAQSATQQKQAASNQQQKQAALSQQQQAAKQQQAPSPVPQAEPPPAPPPQTPTPSIFDAANIPALMNLPTAPDRGFDSEATATANLTEDQRTAFKAHLKKCWKLPGGVPPNQTTRIVLRVYLQRDGKLAGEPQLIEASASREGPLVMQAAIRTLKECQPFGFLPADKYREWKTLDLSFSPREMAGG